MVLALLCELLSGCKGSADHRYSVLAGVLLSDVWSSGSRWLSHSTSGPKTSGEAVRENSLYLILVVS